MVSDLFSIWLYVFFFFNDTATTEIYTLSLHDALPICFSRIGREGRIAGEERIDQHRAAGDRKSTRLNSSHVALSRMPSSFLKKKTQPPQYLAQNPSPHEVPRRHPRLHT